MLDLHIGLAPVRRVARWLAEFADDGAVAGLAGLGAVAGVGLDDHDVQAVAGMVLPDLVTVAVTMTAM